MRKYEFFLVLKTVILFDLARSHLEGYKYPLLNQYRPLHKCHVRVLSQYGGYRQNETAPTGDSDVSAFV